MSNLSKLRSISLLLLAITCSAASQPAWALGKRPVSCNPGFQPFLGACIPINCGPGYQLTNGSCTPDPVPVCPVNQQYVSAKALCMPISRPCMMPGFVAGGAKMELATGTQPVLGCSVLNSNTGDYGACVISSPVCPAQGK